VLYREGEPGTTFDCILTGAICVLEGDTEVSVLHRPATFGERALEEEVTNKGRATHCGYS
jgi:hypothetical protein